MEDKEDILEELVQINKPLLVSAGPGMGKTYALAYKIRHLIKDQKVDKNEITVITFTNEAAINMRKRISQEGDKRVYVEPELQPPVICTMHKLGHRIIKDNYPELDVGLERDFKVFSSQDLKDILMADCSQIVGEKRENAKETIICRQKGRCERTDSKKCEICSEYTGLLRRFNYIDHDDQIFLACEILRENDDILRKEQLSAKYLLVDEYQDINYAQWEFIKLLSKGNTENLFVVGDEFQSIYGFRGGDPIFMKSFKDDYRPNAEVKELLISRRCPPNILNGAFHMVHRYNGGDIRILEKIDFKNKSNVKIKVCNFVQQNLEADFIAREIREIGTSYDVLILVPKRAYIIPIRRALRKKFINSYCEYDIEKTDLHLLNILINWIKEPSDNFNFRLLLENIINKGASDIPAKQAEYHGLKETKEKREQAFKQISNFWGEVRERRTLYVRFKTLKDEALFKKLVETIATLRKIYETEKDILNFTHEAISRLKLWLKKSKFFDEINSVIGEIKNIAVTSGECGVRILTMRKAKGLGADYIFVVGLENNILPRINANDNAKQEDSRLLYVSMTRAKKELYLLSSERRTQNITGVEIAGKSDFINDIPPKYVVEEH
ncbi:MAG: ATP-dependent helicase [Desulfobacteraceae bacterium]|nr:ATP-dependent helicase [Desulfobacteraceae bacterium]